MFSVGPDLDIALQRRRVINAAPHGSNLLPEFNLAAAQLRNSVRGEAFTPAIELLGELFCNQLIGGNADPLLEVPWRAVLHDDQALDRLRIAAAASACFSRREQYASVSATAPGVAEIVLIDFVRDTLHFPEELGSRAADEVRAWFDHLPEALAELSKLSGQVPEDFDRNSQPPLAVLSSALLRLMSRDDMPAHLAQRFITAICEMPSEVVRERLIEKLSALVHENRVEMLVGDARAPWPLGHATLLGAVKAHWPDSPHLGEEPYVHQVYDVPIPRTKSHWEYIDQRLTAIASIRDPAIRTDRFYRYLNLIVESLAADWFLQTEEGYFRELRLDGKSLSETQAKFYLQTYGVDNGPAPDGSREASISLRETMQEMRYVAATRYSLGILKGYTRTLESGRWLLEEFVEEAGGESLRFRVKNNEGYPGPGTVVSGLDVGRAVDLSSKESREYHFGAAPWLKTGAEWLPRTDFYFMRGWIAAARRYDERDASAESGWPGTVDGQRYVAMWFNDHFHNQRLPEVRMWLVPEAVFFNKIQFARENGVDVNRLDLTPEGIAEAAAAAQLPILNVGTSSVVYGSLANAWPFGEGEAQSWEARNSWRDSQYQDPFHIHRALASGTYTGKMTNFQERIFSAALHQHQQLLGPLRFFQSLHSSILSIEEAWTKGYLVPGESPAKLEPTSTGGSGAAADESRHLSPADLPSDLSSFQAERVRERLLAPFVDLRNQIWLSTRSTDFDVYPRIELQYTRLFSRQQQTPVLHGADMCVHFPDGRLVSLAAEPNEVYKQRIEPNEHLESAWLEFFVPQFRANNCPRIFLP